MKLLFKVKCSKCKRRLADLFKGGSPGEVVMTTRVENFALSSRKADEGVAIARCPLCGTETEFPAKYMPQPPMPKPGESVH